MHPTNTYLVARHAESENNVLGIENSKLSNKDQYGLTQEGQKYTQKQTEQYQQENPNSPIHLIFSSPFRRAYETAQPFSTIAQTHIQTDDRLAEVDVGIFDEKPYEIVDQFYLDNAETTSCPQGESLAQAKARALNFITEINAKHTNQTILIVSHGYIVHQIIKAFIPDFNWHEYQQTHDHSRKIFEIRPTSKKKF